MHDYPASDAEEDVAATRHVDGFRNRWFLDPLYHAEYPADIVEHYAASLPHVEDGDMAAIAAPIDVLGINTYSRGVIGAGPDGGRPIFVRPPDSEYTDMDWEVYPDGLHDLLVRLRDDYAPARIAVTENGAAFSDLRGHDGRVRDPERQAYLERHIEAVARAVENGVPVSGYYVWSLLDNFEWAHGYAKRFGIVYVDYPTLERVPKGSFEWYRDFIAAEREAAAARAGATSSR
jgi:beta-glucosidase